MKKENRIAPKILSLILAFCLILSLGIVSSADTISVPDSPGGVYIVDEAEVFDLDSENTLNTKSEKLNNETGIEFYIVTTADKNGASLKDYTYAIFDSWKIGGTENKGIILVLDIEGDSYYLKPSDEIREVYTGTVLQGYLDTFLEADFANGNYSDGAAKLHDAVSVLGRRSYTITSESESESETEVSETEESEAAEESGNGFLDFLGGFFTVILIIFLILAALVIFINVRGQIVKKKRREARQAARNQRQTQRKPLSYPEKKVVPIKFEEEDFEEIESSSDDNEEEIKAVPVADDDEDDEEIHFNDIDNALNINTEVDEDDELIISAFDEIIAKKQAEKLAGGDFDDDDIDDFEEDDEEFEDEEDEE